MASDVARHRVPRFGATERTLHWLHAVAFFIMLASGLMLYLPALAERAAVADAGPEAGLRGGES
jgi:cytochrome b subunit of formate dehydrogenase